MSEIATKPSIRETDSSIFVPRNGFALSRKKDDAASGQQNLVDDDQSTTDMRHASRALSCFDIFDPPLNLRRSSSANGNDAAA